MEWYWWGLIVLGICLLTVILWIAFDSENID